MTSKNILERFSRIRIWRSEGERAPYKPLLLIWAIGRCLRGEDRLASFDLTDSEVTPLIRAFGPNRNTSTHYPFWRLRSDCIWEIDKPYLVRTTSSHDAFKSDLSEHGIRGGLMETFYDRFQTEPELAMEIVLSLLGRHFPDTLHQDILRAVGLRDNDELPNKLIDLEGLVITRHRPGQGAFRRDVLRAYRERCAVCEFSVRVQGKPDPLALEAAHIRWHTESGPMEIQNGLSLCALHHKLFDYGTFTILPDLSVFVSESASGQGVKEMLRQYHKEELRGKPERYIDRPAGAYLSWHHREVFQTPDELLSGQST
ncbi:MAG: HNH endonuclease [Chloroflexi bacterium]|nr:HNH endonuclease [Chloroflexota bacterium]